MTLEDMFPGKMGKMKLVRVMLRHVDLELDRMSHDQRLTGVQVRMIREAIEEDQHR